MEQRANGNPFGAHRVISPEGVLPQPADKIDNNMDYIYDNEILVDVEILNVDSASFTQLKTEANGDEEKIGNRIKELVEKQGKMRNPVTGSGGMFIGVVRKIGDAIKDKVDIKEGDRISSLVSLSLTPLKIDEITSMKSDIDQVFIKGQAILFESGIYAKLPDDMPAGLALSTLDVAGAPAQTIRYVKPGDTVVIIGASGKSGILCAYEAKKAAGDNGKIIGIGHSEAKVAKLKEFPFCDHVLRLNAQDALECYDAIAELTDGEMADIVINCVNVSDTEMASILMTKDRGIIYFFSMATSFTKAALGAEGVGKDIHMIVGNGYAHDHANIALNILRESPQIREYYESVYA